MAEGPGGPWPANRGGGEGVEEAAEGRRERRDPEGSSLPTWVGTPTPTDSAKTRGQTFNGNNNMVNQ